VGSRDRQRVKRLYWNVRLLGLPEPLRDVWMLAVTALVVWALTLQGQQAEDAARTASQTARVAKQTADNARLTARNARQTVKALCALRHDLEQRVAGGEQFLREHPHGIPGFPAETVRTSIAGQRRTIRALSDLTCPAP
jgi:ABC-type transporter Mla subunit MlaD